MVESHGGLDQPLQELALRLRSLPPDILQDLMGFKELGGVEKSDPVKVRRLRTPSIVQVNQGISVRGVIQGKPRPIASSARHGLNPREQPGERLDACCD